MPSPIGHALAGIAVGCVVGGRASGLSPLCSFGWAALFQRRDCIAVLLFGLLGILPDTDFIFGQHSKYTHSIGAVILIGALVLACVGWSYLNTALAASGAYGSHVLLDWLGTDTTVPYGVMALWPFTDAYFLSGQEWFPTVCREYWLTNCWLENIRGALWELILLGPVAAIALYTRKFD